MFLNATFCRNNGHEAERTDGPRARRTESSKGSSRCPGCFTDQDREVGVVLLDQRIVSKDELSAKQWVSRVGGEERRIRTLCQQMLYLTASTKCESRAELVKKLLRTTYLI